MFSNTPKTKPELKTDSKMPSGVLVKSPAKSFLARPRATKRSTPRRGRSRKESKVPSLPPDLATHGRQILSARLRYDVTSTVSQVAINDYELMAGVGCIAISTTILATIASAVRLKRITIWPNSGGEATVYWATTMGSGPGQPDVGHDESIPTGVTIDRPVMSVPPKNAIAAFWHNPLSSSPQALLKLSATAGSLIDVEVDFTLCRDIIPTQLTVSGATQGSFYGFYLDGNTSHKLQPLVIASL